MLFTAQRVDKLSVRTPALLGFIAERLSWNYVKVNNFPRGSFIKFKDFVLFAFRVKPEICLRLEVKLLEKVANVLNSRSLIMHH